jgi:hypothetical protein
MHAHTMQSAVTGTLSWAIVDVGKVTVSMQDVSTPEVRRQKESDRNLPATPAEAIFACLQKNSNIISTLP